MSNNGIFYSSGNTLNFTTSGTTWLSLNSSGLLSGLNLSMSAVTTNTISATTYQNLPTFSGGTITGLTVNGNLTVTGNTSLRALTATTISATTITGNDLIVNSSFEFIDPVYDSRVIPYNNVVSFNSSKLVKVLANDGYGGDEDLVSGAVFLTLSNDSDSRAIEILYTLRSTNDDNFRSGKIIANWDGTYTNFYQTEYGPNYDLTTMTFIDPPRVFYGGSGTIIRVKIDFDDVTDPANLLTARFKYTLI